jgi:hypothetical protein
MQRRAVRLRPSALFGAVALGVATSANAATTLAVSNEATVYRLPDEPLSMYPARYGFIPVDSSVTHVGDVLRSSVLLRLHAQAPLANHYVILDRRKLPTDDLRAYIGTLPTVPEAAEHETTLPSGSLIAKVSIRLVRAPEGMRNQNWIDSSWGEGVSMPPVAANGWAIGPKLILNAEFNHIVGRETRSDELTVALHGLSTHFERPVPELASAIHRAIRDQGLRPNIPIRLLSCRAGACKPGDESGAAQQLAEVLPTRENPLGNEVRAGTELITIPSDPRIPVIVDPPVDPAVSGPRWRAFRSHAARRTGFRVRALRPRP